MLVLHFVCRQLFTSFAAALGWFQLAKDFCLALQEHKCLKLEADGLLGKFEYDFKLNFLASYYGLNMIWWQSTHLLEHTFINSKTINHHLYSLTSLRYIIISKQNAKPNTILLGVSSTKLQGCHLRCHFRSNLRGFACLCHDLDQLDKIPVGKLWVFPRIGVGPQNGWFIMETLIKMDDLGVPLFLETTIWRDQYDPLESFDLGFAWFQNLC